MATATHHKTIVGVFSSVHEAQSAVRDLESMGIDRDNISIVANKNAVGYDSMDPADRDKTADVVADAGIGAAIGGVGGLLLSAAGAITVPVIGPILAAGPIAAALTGAGIGAAAGGLIGALTESGVPEEDARYYAEGVRRGDVLVTVRTDEARSDTVCDILDRHNAVDVDDRVRNWRERGWSGYREDENPFTDEELREERRRYGYTGATITGATGIGVDRERANLHRDRDDLRQPIPSTEASNLAGDIGTSGIVGTTGMTSGGLGSTSPHDYTHHHPHDERSMGEKIGDKLRDWKDDVKDRGRELRSEARETEHRMEHRGDDIRGSQYDRDRITDRYADTTTTRDLRSSREIDTRDQRNDLVDEMKQDMREAGRDVNDIAHGRTGQQPHDRWEDAREAERRRRARVYDRW